MKTIVYRLPQKDKAGKKGGRTAGDDEVNAAPKAQRPEVTQKGQAMIGDFRTDALHQALQDADIDQMTMIGLLVLAFAGRNVSVQSGAALGKSDREQIAETLTEGGTLTRDSATIQSAARAMLAAVLSCRDNMTNSGALARIAGDCIGAGLHLPNMATEDFLSCLSKAGVEKAAAAEGVRIGARAKDTRAAMIDLFATGVYVYPEALFRLTEQELADLGNSDGYETDLDDTETETADDNSNCSWQDDEDTFAGDGAAPIAAE